jgi:hypothetical protein
VVIKVRRNFMALQLTMLLALAGEYQAFGEPAVRVLASVKLKELVAGVRIPRRVGSRITAMRIGQVAVEKLFVFPAERAPSAATYYLRRSDDILVKVRDEAALQELRAIALVRESMPLEVVLRDDTKSAVRSFYERCQSLFPALRLERVVRIPLELELVSTCDRVTRIFYHGVDSILSSEVRRAGQTQVMVSLDAVFTLLLKERIEPFLASLDPVTRADPCFGTFGLLKWLRHEEVERFEWGGYSLLAGLKGILFGVAESLMGMQRQHQLNRIEIDLVGYADPTAVKAIPLRAADTGVDDLSAGRYALRVHYGGCSGDKLTGNAPRLVEFLATGGLPAIGDAIKSNCELGAVRAYVAAAYLKGRLGNRQVSYRYGTGGVLRADVDDARKRKVDVRIRVMGAKELARGKQE